MRPDEYSARIAYTRLSEYAEGDARGEEHLHSKEELVHLELLEHDGTTLLPVVLHSNQLTAVQSSCAGCLWVTRSLCHQNAFYIHIFVVR